MTPALRARILANLPNSTSEADGIQANTTATQTATQATNVTTTQATNATTTQAIFPPIEIESIVPIEPTHPSQSAPANTLPDDRHTPPSSEFPEGDISDSLSYTSPLPEVFETGTDDLAPLATGPWTIIDHLTGEMIIDEEEVPFVPPTAPSILLDSVIQVEVVMGFKVLVQTSRPTLLFIDQDECPDWLIRSTNEFLLHVPYYMCLSEVVDLFFHQEARLGYPSKVSALCFPFVAHADNLFITHQSTRLALPSCCRPPEVAMFMKRAQDFSWGDKVDAEKFGAQVLAWWITIQPTTRKAWPPSYEPLPDNFSFEYFKRGGPNGVFLVILCLSWWANALTADTDHTSFRQVVHNVRWVLQQVAAHALCCTTFFCPLAHYYPVSLSITFIYLVSCI